MIEQQTINTLCKYIFKIPKQCTDIKSEFKIKGLIPSVGIDLCPYFCT
jgi:retron-type reverse transcriptase